MVAPSSPSMQRHRRWTRCLPSLSTAKPPRDQRIRSSSIRSRFLGVICASFLMALATIYFPGHCLAGILDNLATSFLMPDSRSLQRRQQLSSSTHLRPEPSLERMVHKVAQQQVAVPRPDGPRVAWLMSFPNRYEKILLVRVA